MKKIVIDARTINSSGIGSYLQNLIPLITAQYDLVLLVLKKDAAAYDRYRDIRTVTCSSPIYSISEQLELPLKVPVCDIFWSPHYNVPLFPVRAKRRLVTIHDVFHLAFYKRLTPAQKLYAKFMLSSAVKLSDRIITISNFSKSEIIKYLNTDGSGIRVIHNGINSVDYRVLDNKELSNAKNRLGLPDNYILFVGNVKPHKNLKSLLTSCRGLFDCKLKNYKLVIVGKKDGFITEDREVFEMIENDPLLKEHVIFTGYVRNEDLPVIYNRASLLAFPTLYEGFGFPPLEAMACGCPAVVSNAASLPEVCGEAAYYVNPHNVEDIASGIHNVLQDAPLRQALTAKGLERAKLFKWGKSAKEHMKVFDEVLSN